MLLPTGLPLQLALSFKEQIGNLGMVIYAVISAHGSRRQEDCREFMTSLVYTVGKCQGIEGYSLNEVEPNQQN